jgi:hypothetical protein
MAKTIEPKRKSRTTLIAVSVGVVAAGSLIAYGFSRSDDDPGPATDIPPTIGVIQAPAAVQTTQNLGANRTGSTPATADVPVVPVGTADIASPPVSSNILVP